MKKLKVTIAHIEEHSGGIFHGINITFQVIQNGCVLVEDSLSGKATHDFSKTYEVNASEADIYVVHDRHDLNWLTITAELIE